MPNSCSQTGTKTCKQKWGEHTCVCKKGFKGKDCSEDINECVVNDGKPRCPEVGYLCKNTITNEENPNGYKCVVAGKGWEPTSKTVEHWGISYPIMVDINECELSTEELVKLGFGEEICSVMQECVNKPGGYECVCKAGFSEDPETSNCVDVDECMNPSTCEGLPNTVCHNNDGSYTCDCKVGYSTGFGDQSGNTCEDINECETLEDPCDPITTECQNTDGSFICACKYNYVPARTSDISSQRCVDFDECVDGDVVCPLNSHCNNLDSAKDDRGYECVCDAGFSAVMNNGTLDSCSECGFEFGYPALFNVKNGDDIGSEVKFFEKN